ncbi:hypothetical protein [Candidatus Methylacidithermus pantelleriae]|nr:hypothetical protein [Candidatus Methylacidithermus pantelleriae]
MTRRLAGTVGIEINEDHLALVEMGLLGQFRENPLDPTESPQQERGRSQSDFLGMRARRLARVVQKWGKALVIERWDLWKRKLKFESVDPVRARSLFSFAYWQGDRDCPRGAILLPESRCLKSTRCTRL